MSPSFRPYFVVPMKDPAIAKSRLRANLSNSFCERISVLMFERTIRLLRENFSQVPVLVVTESVAIARQSLNQGCITFREASPPGLNVSAWSASQWGLHHEFDSQILIHADIPLLSAEEVAKTLAAVSERETSVAICQSWSGGTSILATRRPDVINFQFGVDSYNKHLEAARKRGIQVAELNFVGASMDLDSDTDLADILNHGSGTDAGADVLNMARPC